MHQWWKELGERLCNQDNSDDEYEEKMFLPVEMVTDILSRLPVETLARCRCVCKLWCAVIDDHKFVRLHMDRSDLVFKYTENTNINDENDETFHVQGVLGIQDGLLLEKGNFNGKSKYRMRNPTTGHTFALPDPHPQSLTMTILYVPNTDDYKLVSLFHCKLEGAKQGVGCQVLRIGTDVAWRDVLNIDSASSYDAERLVDLKTIEDVSYFFISGSSDIICMQAETEHLVYTKFPQDFFTSLKEFKAFLWDYKKLALYNLVERELHVWILEDYKKGTWSTRRIPLLNLFSDHPQTLKTLKPCNCSCGWLVFLKLDDGTLVIYITLMPNNNI